MICIEKRLNFQNIKSDLRLKGVLFEIFCAVICLFFLDFYRFFDISGAITEPDVTRFSQNDCQSCKVIPSDRICSYKPLSQREHSYFFENGQKWSDFWLFSPFPGFPIRDVTDEKIFPRFWFSWTRKALTILKMYRFMRIWPKLEKLLKLKVTATLREEWQQQTTRNPTSRLRIHDSVPTGCDRLSDCERQTDWFVGLIT